MLTTIAKISPVPALEGFESFLLSDYQRAKRFLMTVNPEMLEEISQKKAVKMFKQAAQKTPAYSKFLARKGVSKGQVKSIDTFNKVVPATDKECYIKKFPLEQRCQYGKLPKYGNVDESGGTSGIPTNWIHDFKEEELLFKSVKFEFNYAFDGQHKDYFVISAWSVGPWATGIKFSELMEKLALVKNTATDPKDIVNTLKMFGKKRNYLLGGYPPFVKSLIDTYGNQINWKDYNIDFVIGGEGVTLDWVYYMKSKLKRSAKIISSYGASDIDIGIGFESPFCFAIREVIAKSPELQQKLFGQEGIPMIFQYNPTVHYIRNIEGKNAKQEFEVTLLDRKAVLTKVKYNLHDEGKRFSYNELISLLKEYNPKFVEKYFQRKNADVLKLPFLCVFGRSDGTLSFDGANVFPHQVEQGIMQDKTLARKTNRFKIQKIYNKLHNVQFHIHIELKPRHKSGQILKKKYEKKVLQTLLDVNSDYKESYTHNKKLKPYISLYAHGHKLFEKDDKKVKNIYIMKN